MKEKDFKTEAEEWANEEVRKVNWINAKHYQVQKDFTELMMFGSLGYHIDAKGNKKKLTQQELWEMKSKPEVIITEMNIEQYREYVKSAEKE